MYLRLRVFNAVKRGIITTATLIKKRFNWCGSLRVSEVQYVINLVGSIAMCGLELRVSHLGNLEEKMPQSPPLQ